MRSAFIVLLIATVLPASEALFKNPAAVAPRGGVATRGRVVPTQRKTGAPPPVDAPPELVQTAIDVGITALRLGTCALMVHHGQCPVTATHSHSFLTP